jgi:hypothetical protein
MGGWWYSEDGKTQDGGFEPSVRVAEAWNNKGFTFNGGFAICRE